jgi:hypothetical protein
MSWYDYGETAHDAFPKAIAFELGNRLGERLETPVFDNGPPLLSLILRKPTGLSKDAEMRLIQSFHAQ